MERLKCEYFFAESKLKYSFIMVPRALVSDAAFAGMPNALKLLYSLMLTRTSLSMRHTQDFTDEFGRVYIIYATKEVMADMGVSKPTAVKWLRELENVGLIERIRRGQGKPSIIYVKDFSSLLTTSDDCDALADDAAAKQVASPQPTLFSALDETENDEVQPQELPAACVAPTEKPLKRARAPRRMLRCRARRKCSRASCGELKTTVAHNSTVKAARTEAPVGVCKAIGKAALLQEVKRFYPEYIYYNIKNNYVPKKEYFKTRLVCCSYDDDG